VRHALLLLLAACGAPAEHKLPSAKLSPRVGPPAAVCASEVALNDAGVVDMRYRYTYDKLGRLAHAVGTHKTGGQETLDYAWDNLDHVVAVVQQGGVVRVDIAAQYNSLGDMLAYSRTEKAQGYFDTMTQVYSAFTDAGLPTRQTITQQSQTVELRLEYDATNRIARVVSDDGSAATFYTYDDDARTIAVENGNGAYRGLITFDDLSRELSESWSGTETIAEETLFEYAGDRLHVVTHRSGTPEAPSELTSVQVETYRYSCPDE
jgi:hypothetical protein